VLTVTDGFTTQSLVLTSAIIAIGTGTTTFAAPAPTGTFTVSTFLTDVNGNRGPTASDTAVREGDQHPVYSVLLENGDRFYSTDAGEAALMAVGSANVFEGVRFDSLTPAQGGQQMFVHYQPFTGDWYFSAAGVAPPYACYELQGAMDGFFANPAGVAGTPFHLYINVLGTTQLVTQAEAAQMNLVSQGYVDFGTQFSTTTTSAFTFDAKGYLLANQGSASVQNFVDTLEASFTSTTDPGFVEAVEQNFLSLVALTGVAHGGTATVAQLNAAFGSAFAS
jgi:hypothetical protein